MPIRRKPEWLRKKINPAAHGAMDGMLDELKLHTVCREARCPNITECFRNRQATFLILGADCTRLCSFCNVTKRTPLPPDGGEPARVAEAIVRLGLSHVVITSPTRDDLVDGGAKHYAETVRAIRSASPETVIELLIPDFLGNRGALEVVVASGPDIIGHNLETVPRLYHIRQGADYRRSLRLLADLRELAPELKTKSGIMLGLGEEEEEVLQVLADLRGVDCNYLSIGQYLQPSLNHQPVAGFIEPAVFDNYRDHGLALGFAHVESGPYVRSSYMADRYGRQSARKSSLQQLVP